MNLPTKFHDRNLKIVATIVTTLAALVTIVVTVDPWSYVGWVTPDQHYADIARLEGTINQVKADATEATKDFRDEWKCARLQDALETRLVQQHNGDDSPILAEEIRKLREQIRNLNCDRFNLIN